MEIKISSKNNATISKFLKLKQKKYREKYNMLLLEGERLVNDALKRDVTFKALVLLDSNKSKYTYLYSKMTCPIYIVPNCIFCVLSETDNSQGIIGVAQFKREDFALPKTNFLVLDRISDPGNLGTIIRTAMAGNFKNIYLYNSVDYTNDKCLRATMGTLFDCNLYIVNKDQINELLDNYTVFATTLDGDDIYQINPPREIFGLVVGNEANGIDKQLLKKIEHSIHIPMLNDVESLNVAVATAICIYLLKR